MRLEDDLKGEKFLCLRKLGVASSKSISMLRI